MCPVNMSGREKGFGESESSRLEKGNVAFDVPKPKPGKENIASWECRFEIEGQGCAPRKREQASCTATDVGRWRRQCRERCHMVLRLNFSNVKPASKSPKHMTAAETRFRARSGNFRPILESGGRFRPKNPAGLVVGGPILE